MIFGGKLWILFLLRSVFMYFGLRRRDSICGGQVRLSTCFQILGFLCQIMWSPLTLPAMAFPDPAKGQPWCCQPCHFQILLGTSHGSSDAVSQGSHGHLRFTVYPGIVTPLQLAISHGNSSRAPLWVITRSPGFLLSTHWAVWVTLRYSDVRAAADPTILPSLIVLAPSFLPLLIA